MCVARVVAQAHAVGPAYLKLVRHKQVQRCWLRALSPARWAEQFPHQANHREVAPDLVELRDVLGLEQIAQLALVERNLGCQAETNKVLIDLAVASSSLQHRRAGGQMQHWPDLLPEGMAHKWREDLLHFGAFLSDAQPKGIGR